MHKARQGQRYNPPDRIVGEEERRLITSISRQHWWRLEREGEVPRRIPLGPNKVGWLESELLDWVRSRAALRDQPAAERGSYPRPVGAK
jgi:prophage regulatory protein